MDVALQRPIIVTSSQADKTIRVWNYLTGHCEYCKIILTEKEELDQEIEILSVAIHPNGYYMAVSDNEMIRFFHLCYRELRYYNNDSIGNESTKKNCTLLKFSNGGHLLAAISGRTLYVIKSYSRETLKEFKTPHTSVIKSIIWDINDGYVYTIGTEGLVVEYNVYNFKIEEISTKSVNNSNGVDLPFFIKFFLIYGGRCFTSSKILAIYSPITLIAKILKEPKNIINKITVVIPLGAN